MGTVTQYNMANIRDALGGSNPVSLSQYYRGGPRVPTTRTVTVRDPSSGEYLNRSGPLFFWFQSLTYGGSPLGAAFWWNSASTNAGGGEPTSFTTGGFTYFRGTFNERRFGDHTIEDFYGIFRTSSSTVSINTGVPSSGQISISQLFGAENP